MDATWEDYHGKMIAELTELIDRRTALEEERTRVDERIILLSKAVASAEDLMGRDSTEARKRANATRDYILGPRVADKVRFVLARWSHRPLTARDILTLLSQLGYKFEGDPRPIATIHSLCHRMANAKHPSVEATTKDGIKAWKWII